MSTNMTLITSVTVGSGGAASVTLPATGTIPATYTDLKVVASVRTEGTGSPYLYLRFNGSSSSYSNKRIIGDGSTVGSSTPSDAYIIGGICNTTDQTTNTFSSHDIYILNYAGNNYKSVSVDAVTENNATSARAMIFASLWSNTSAITSIVFTNEAAVDFAEGSTFYLYGISNVTSSTKATGGIVSSDGTYNYHMFPFSGTFTPTQNITADYLVIAGGGGGGGIVGGGGGAGGVALGTYNLSATGYTVTVGAGGSAANNGSNSVFHNATVNGGGRGGTHQGGPVGQTGSAGGSGGGGAPGNAPPIFAGGASNQSAITGATVYGNAGAASSDGDNPYRGGGGGGAGSAGTSGETSGNGGDGYAFTAYANATQTGVNGYYAGGGGGSYFGGTPSGTGGLGGGGAGVDGFGTGISGTVNTGSGGGASGTSGGAGGSGLVIIRYAI